MVIRRVEVQLEQLEANASLDGALFTAEDCWITNMCGSRDSDVDAIKANLLQLLRGAQESNSVLL